jgi:signal transduction histidine kinase
LRNQFSLPDMTWIMTVKTDKGGAETLAFGDILTTEEPVWVWDIEARRILWANSAGRAFWGAETLDALRARRFDPRNKALARMAERATASHQWGDTLTLPGRSGKQPVTCSVQAMQVAGGRTGLLVRAVEGAPQRNVQALELRASEPVPANPIETQALKRLGARVKRAQAARRADTDQAPAAENSGVVAPAAPADGDEAGLPPAMLRELCHELRNPLTVILGFAERIRDSDPVRARGKIKSYAENILEGAQFAMEILADFAGRIRDGNEPPFPPEPADVGAAVSSSLRLVAPLATQAGMTVTKSVGRTLPRLRTEERALKQILLNVLVNAVRHQKTGGKIAVTARMQRNRSLLLSVSDDGIGMTRKEIRAALGAGPKARNKTTSGSGLGLPLVKRLVEGAGGAIAIESARRKGTTVAMTFPPASLLR